MKLLIIPALLALSACSVQHSVDNADFVCKDGVEYFVYEKYTGNGVSYSVVPHFHADGTLFTCERKK